MYVNAESKLLFRSLKQLNNTVSEKQYWGHAVDVLYGNEYNTALKEPKEAA